MPDEDDVRLERHDAVALIRLNRPERGNAVTPEMAGRLVATLAAVSADEQVRAVVLAAAGKVFCAGADRSVLRAALSIPIDETKVRAFYDVIAALRAVPVPLIAAVEGAATGAGLNVALACDLRIAGAQASFDSRFLRIGLHPGGGHTWLLTHEIGRQRAAQLVLVGGPVAAPQALEYGLVMSVVAAGQAEPEALRLAAGVARTERELLVEAKASLVEAPELEYADASAGELRRQLHLLSRPGVREAMATALGLG